jgi:dienelactone hydrolase
MRRLAAFACVLGLIAAACGDDAAAPPVSTSTSTTAAPSTTSSTTTAAPVATVGEPVPAGGCEAEATATRTFVDETRSTPATETAAELPSRTLEVWIDRPTAPGPFPLIVFAHGLTGHPRSHELHRRSLAAQCFVVVAPAFPLTNNDVPGAWSNAGDVSGQIADVSFLIDEVMADAELEPYVDRERIGMIGHSLGGLTTAGAAVSSGADERISAAVVMSAGFAEARDDLPVMVLHGDNDTLIPIATGAAAYAVLPGRGVFVTLLGGDHIAGIIDDDSAYGSVVRGVTGAFFALELDNGDDTVDDVFDLPLDLASIEARSGDGPLADWSDYFAA